MALCLASLFTSYSNAQDSVTGNLVNPTQWGNIIYMNGSQLGQVEGTGGGPTPAFNTDTNTIRFSYTPYTVSQIVAINSVLSGQGISVTGFNYSWKIYNDLENCCGTRGSLFVYGSLTNKSGKVLEYYNYDYSLTNTGAAFQTFAGTETFNRPYQLNSLSDMSISWTGSAINSQSGYYGPRVRDASLTLNYSVKQTTLPESSTTNTGTTSSMEILETVSRSLQESEPDQQTVYSSTASLESEPTTLTGTRLTSNSSSLMSSEAQNSNGGGSKSSKSMSQALSIIRSQQAKNADQANNVTSSAQAQAQTAAGQAISESESIAADAAIISATVGQSSISLFGTTGSSSSMSLGGINANKAGTEDYSTSNDNSVASVSYNLQQSGRQTVFDIELPRTEGLKINSGSPLDNILDPTTETQSSPMDQPTNNAKKNVQNNELAAGVDITKMTIQPQGYQAYSMTMPDVAFYAPKEIYKNQVNVDNARLLRSLSSDRLHQELVNQQYKGK